VCKQRGGFSCVTPCSSVVTHCSLFTVEMGRSSTGSFSAVLSPLGVAFYYLVAIWLYSILCGRVPCLVYGMDILKQDAY
jgi:hypothetical protein